MILPAAISLKPWQLILLATCLCGSSAYFHQHVATLHGRLHAMPRAHLEVSCLASSSLHVVQTILHELLQMPYYLYFTRSGLSHLALMLFLMILLNLMYDRKRCAAMTVGP